MEIKSENPRRSQPFERWGMDDAAPAAAGYNRRLAAAAAMAASIFILDTFTSLGSAIAVLYVLVIVLADGPGGRYRLLAHSAACAILALASFLYVHGIRAEPEAVLRLVFSMAANAVTTAILWKRRTDRILLEESEHRYRNIFETLAVAIWEHDFRQVKAELVSLRKSGVTDMRRYIEDHPEFVIRTRRMVRITDVNRTALRLMDVPTKEEFFTHLADFLPENDASFAQCLIALDEGHATFQSETTIRSRSGRMIPVIVILSFPQGEGLGRIQASIVDITERLEFQEALESSRQELEHASRAAMIGEISASIAHEVNQPLSAIMTSVQAAQRWLNRTQPDLEETRLALDDVVLSTERASAVVKRVRMLLGKAQPENGAVSVDTIVADAVRLKQKELSDHAVTVSMDLRANGAVVLGDRVLLQQTFLNVIANAVQAMEEAKAGMPQLTIRTAVDKTDLIVVFEDSGPGLGENDGESLFKAFSTTKPNGMGLGLAICRSIVMAHDGYIAIGNRPGASGAQVEIRLPLIAGLAAPDMTLSR
ncbi:sensor histidine kinase [Rhizobium puerariae]|uniref:histidine kinase n=1 Tax=Rhizobium puerariae TaxID=1585791 RepID=A0ABV6AGY5_9HYPH